MKQRHLAFAREYLVDGNGRQAAIRVGYGTKNAARTAWELLHRPDVQAELKRLTRLRANRTRLSDARLVKELARIAFSDIRNYTQWGPEGVELRPYAELSDDDAAAIAEVTQYTSGKGARLRLHDKRGALEALARYLAATGRTGRKGPGPAMSPIEQRERARAALRKQIERVIKARNHKEIPA